MSAIPVAFYAPLKSPDHPSPSGDRTMGRLLVAALAEAGCAPRLASRLRTFEPAGDDAAQRRLRDESAREADRLERLWGGRPEERPALWFTYHTYYKAPDHLGPDVSRRLAIPYMVAEPSLSARRAEGPWRASHDAVAAGLASADALFVLTGKDRAGLAALPAGRLVDLPPFLDVRDWPHPPARPPASEGVVRLLAVAMMRHGDKLASYRLLAQALGRAGGGWHLDVVGDGPARPEVEAAFAADRDRVVFHGGTDDRRRLAERYAAADLLVWPAVNEAYGMVLLEAQAMGCPVVAGGFGGVRDAMRPGETGLLVAPGDPAAFASAVSRLAADPARRRAMGEAGLGFVRGERSLAAAAAILRRTIARHLPSIERA